MAIVSSHGTIMVWKTSSVLPRLCETNPRKSYCWRNIPDNPNQAAVLQFGLNGLTCAVMSHAYMILRSLVLTWDTVPGKGTYHVYKGGGRRGRGSRCTSIRFIWSLHPSHSHDKLVNQPIDHLRLTNRLFNFAEEPSFSHLPHCSVKSSAELLSIRSSAA